MPPESKQITIRPLVAQDKEAFYAWVHDQETMSLAMGLPPGTQELKDYCDHYILRLNNDDIITLVIQKDATVIGCIHLRPYQQGSQSKVILGIVLGHEYQGQGYGTQAMRLAIDYCFDKLEFDEIDLDTVDFNPRAKRCFEKLGFEFVQKEKARCEHHVFNRIFFRLKNNHPKTKKTFLGINWNQHLRALLSPKTERS